MDRTTVGRAIQPLERDGLIGVGPAPSDRRTKQLHVPKAGEKRVQAGLEGWAKAQARFEAGSGARHAAALRTLLQAVSADQIQADSAKSRTDNGLRRLTVTRPSTGAMHVGP
jgi:DNA-binding MarR family transcriptional regulator